MKPLVSIIIPTKNSGGMLAACLASIRNQTYSPIEILIVDSGSRDNTVSLAKRFGCRLLTYAPRVPAGTFDATAKRNFGVRTARGTFVYYVDADMELDPALIAEAVSRMDDSDALIIPEISFGIGPWARAKDLEKRCYFGDTTIEAPRFFRKEVWQKLGGLDETLRSGRDDGDLYFKLVEGGYRTGRTVAVVRHNEGRLTVRKLFLKKFFYGKDVLRYVRKRPVIGIRSYMPVRASYFRNWRLFLSRPSDSLYFVMMKVIESLGGLTGVVTSLVRPIHE